MSFVDARFPESYAYGAICTDDWLTEVVETRSRVEHRNAPAADVRLTWDLSTTGKTAAQRDGIRDYFRAMRGPLHSFPFRDLFDYECARSTIATGDGAEQDFQLVKPYTIGSETYNRTITKPVTASVRIWVNGVEQVSGWSVSRTTGIVTFTVAPADSAVIEASFEFDVPVRFAESRLAWRAENRNAAHGLIFFCESLTLIEVIGE
jgi:uncharacterized protein (TIGR02217 family)